jgi:PAS domain S-box-containing protein
MAERGLVQSERRFRLLAESIAHHVWVFRPGATGAGEAPQALSYWNRRLADYTGLSDAELQSGGWQALHPDDVERVTAAWRHAYETVSQYQLEQRVRGADGRYRRFVCRALPAVADDGGAVEWFGTNTDVEDMRQAAEALRRSQAELAHVARTTTLGELAASIAHEVNQPLTAVVANGGACIRWLAAEPPNLGEALDAVGRIVNDANRAAAIIRRIREFLRRGKEELMPIDLGTSVADALALIHSQIRERNVALRVVVADGLPPVLSDRVQVQQVVVNLAMNAIEAMAAVTDRERTLEVRTERHDDHLLCVSIRDSGVGFAAATRSRMFEAFHTTKAGGMGMGLTISRTIVEAHGGLLWAEANADHGQTFRFTLPIAAA